MFDFIEILRKTFAEYYKEKRLAKRQIKHLKELLKFWNDVNMRFKRVRNAMKNFHETIPQREGFGYVEFTEFQNFLLYGTQIPGSSTRIGRGYIDDIEHRHIDTLTKCIERAEEYYKRKKYSEVERYCKEYYDECVYFDKNYGTNTKDRAEYPKF